MEGSGVVCATHPSPGWGQAPALHFSCDPGLSLFGRRWLVSPAGAGIDPGSAFGTCIPAIDRKFRLGAGSVQGRSWIQHLGKLFHHRGGGEHITGRIVVADIVLLQVLIDIAVEAREIHLMRFEKINVT